MDEAVSSISRRYFIKTATGCPIAVNTIPVSQLIAAHIDTIYKNNCCELSQQTTRYLEQQIKRLKFRIQAHSLLSCHAVIVNLFRLGRYLIKEKNYCYSRDHSLTKWTRASCLQTIKRLQKNNFYLYKFNNLIVPEI